MRVRTAAPAAGDADGRGGNEELLFKREGEGNGVVRTRRLDHVAEGFEEAREGRFQGGEESKGMLFEEDEEVEFEVVR